MCEKMSKQPRVQYVHLGGIATQVLVFDPDSGELQSGDSINNNNSRFEFDRLILWICGNPGPVNYYRQLLSNLHVCTGLPVIGLSNSGHDAIPEEIPSIEINNQNRELFGLESQIQYKMQFIRKFLKPEAKIFLLAHSVGCYMTLELLDRCPDIQKMIVHSVLLFPTIASLAKTDSGRSVNRTFTYFRFPVMLTLYFLNYVLSRANKIRLFRLFFWLTGQTYVPDHVIEAATNLIDPKCVDATVTMVMDEFKEIDLPKLEIIKANRNILSLFYGEADHWAPIEYYWYLEEKLHDQDNVDIRLCLGTIDHAFVLKPEDVDKISKLCCDVLNKKIY